MTCNTRCGCHWNPVALGLALGILWGLCVLIMGLMVNYAMVGTTFITSSGIYYLGYGPTLVGSIVGGLIAFVHAFIKGFLVAWLYNMFAGCCAGCCKKDM